MIEEMNKINPANKEKFRLNVIQELKNINADDECIEYLTENCIVSALYNDTKPVEIAQRLKERCGK